MNEIMAIWAEWLKPSAGLPTVQWSLLLAAAAAVGHLLQRHTGLPKVVGYSLTGALAGLAGFSGAAWPLQGIALFLLELACRWCCSKRAAASRCAGSGTTRWCCCRVCWSRLLTALCVYYTLRWMGVRPTVAEADRA